MLLLLLGFGLVILGYSYVTDSRRVRGMAEKYLSQVMGGRVSVGGATLSVFEGLKLDEVRVYVDDGGRPDSLIFSAKTFILKYDPGKIIAGQLEAEQIIAQKPYVYLTQDTRTGEWNFNRIGGGKPMWSKPAPEAQPVKLPPLPEVLLRNARVVISEIRDGRKSVLGYKAIDGHLTPVPGGGRYGFELQTRGVEGAGPWASGVVALADGDISAELHNFDFDRDVQSMLPIVLRDWWVRHGLAGRVDIPEFRYHPGQGTQKARFRVETVLNGVTISVPHEDWMAREEVARLGSVREGVRAMRGLYALAAFGAQSTDEEGTKATNFDAGLKKQNGAGGTEGPLGNAGKKPADADGARTLTLAPPKSGSVPPSDSASINPAAPASDSLHSDLPVRPFVHLSLSPARHDHRSPIDAIPAMTESSPIQLKQGAGVFVFTENGIDVRDVAGRVEDNGFKINGHMAGYGPDAPFDVQISSLDTENMYIPAAPRYLNSLPPIVRDIYTMIHPEGQCRVLARVKRPTPGARPLIDGQVDIVEGKFFSPVFPYPMRDTNGRIAFGTDAKTGYDFVRIIGLRGCGPPDGPNRDKYIQVDGEVGPLGPGINDPQVALKVHGTDITCDRALRSAFPSAVKEPMKILDADGKGEQPLFRGDFSSTVYHGQGWAWRWTFDTDLEVADASIKLKGFPYPLEHLSGELKVRERHLDIVNAHTKKGNTSLVVNGRVTWEDPDLPVDGSPMPPPGTPKRPVIVRTDVQVSVHDLPVDTALLAAMPPDEREWLKKIGATARIDVEGGVFSGIDRSGMLLGPEPPKHLSTKANPEEVCFDLGITLHDGTLWPAEGTFSVSDVSGKLHLSQSGLQILDLHGRRDKAALQATGAITWADGPPEVALRVHAQELAMDAPLYAMLPADGRKSWDEVQPQGAIDADMTFRWMGEEGTKDTGTRGHGDAGKGKKDAETRGRGDARNGVVDPGMPKGAADGNGAASATLGQGPSTAPSGLFPVSPLARASASTPAPVADSLGNIPMGFTAVLKPRGLSCSIKSMPYRLELQSGTIRIKQGSVTIEEVTARHGAGTLSVSGTGSTGERPVWDLRLMGKDVAVDDELRAALPAVLLSVIDSMKLHGSIDFEFPKFVYRGEGLPGAGAATVKPAGPATAAGPASTVAAQKAAGGTWAPASAPATAPAPLDIDLASVITLNGCSLDAGVPLQDVSGKLRMAATVRDGKLSAMQGDLDISKLTMAGRKLDGFKADLIKPADRNEFYIDKMRATVAGGQMAGQIHLTYPDDAPSRYLLSLVLRNADVKELTADKDFNGQLTASLALEGAWGDNSIRRGRGDVLVTGKELYRIPLLMGLLQVTNLSLPIATPFKTGTARYSVDGQRLNFEQVELKSDNMVMTGTGHLDFKNKQVLMTFVTDNAGGFKVPFINDLLKGARSELFKFTIKGTIQQPKVEANPFGTFSTTVDEVFKADEKKK
jgi:hypothetical protein